MFFLTSARCHGKGRDLIIPGICDGGRGVAKPEWGVKRICPSCGARYYDMRKDPPVCPSCNAQFDPEALLKSRKARPAPVDDTKKAVVAEDEDAEVETEESETAELDEAEDGVSVDDIEEAEDPAEDEDDVLIEDTSELGEDDMDEVVDVEGEDEEER
nr:TIGR02300 family protein [Azospirillum doebereinerae]